MDAYAKHELAVATRIVAWLDSHPKSQIAIMAAIILAGGVVVARVFS